MKALISRDEWAPCYYLDYGDVEGSVEIDPELEARYEHALVEFWMVQKELAELYYSRQR